MTALLPALGLCLLLVVVLVAVLGSISPRSRLSPWRSPAVRYRAWRVAGGIGRIETWAAAGARSSVLILAVAALLGLAVVVTKDIPIDLTLQDGVLLALLAVAAVLWVTVRSVRSRIFVPEFEVHGEIAKTIAGEALAARLRHELAAITSVHRTVDEALPSSHGRISSLEITVDDIGERLEETIGPDLFPAAWDKLKIGPLLALLARATGVFRGPRLSGHLHQEGRSLELTVELSGGGGKRGSWLVGSSDLSADPAAGAADPGRQAADVYRMVRQMAYRIAAGMASLGSPRWEALAHFTDGLRAYRMVRLTRSRREIELRRAERCFRDALEADNTFSQGHYNLGVVYALLKESEAALAAFRRAIQNDPLSDSAHLAVATVYFRHAARLFSREASEEEVTDHFRQARVFACRARDLAPSEPRAHNVYAAARICEGWRGPKPRAPIRDWEEAAAEAVDVLRLASALSWRRMCRHALTGGQPSTDQARVVTLLCLENLAEILFEARRVDESIRVLRELRRLDRRKPSVRLALGKALAVTAPSLAEPGARLRRLVEARDELFEVHGDGLPLEQRAPRWAWLLAIHSELSLLLGPGEERALSGRRSCPLRESDEREGVERAFRCALDRAVPSEEFVLAHPPAVEPGAGPRDRRYGKQFELLRYELGWIERFRRGMLEHRVAGPGREAERSRYAATWYRLCDDLRALEEIEAGRLDGRPLPPPESEWTWRNVQLAVRRARGVLASDPGRAEELLRRAIAVLGAEHSRQVREQGLESLLAMALLRQANRPEPPAEGGARAGAGRGERSRPECLHEALDYAFRSVAGNPESAARRLVLARVHDALGDHRQFLDEWHAALSLGSPLVILADVPTLEELAASWRRYLDGGDRRQQFVREAIEFFEGLRDLLEASAVPAPEPGGGTRPLRFREHAAIHYHLGRFYYEGGRRDEAVENLGIALASGYQPGDLGAADAGFRHLLETVGERRPGRPAASRPEAAGGGTVPEPILRVEAELPAWLSGAEQPVPGERDDRLLGRRGEVVVGALGA